MVRCESSACPTSPPALPTRYQNTLGIRFVLVGTQGLFSPVPFWCEFQIYWKRRAPACIHLIRCLHPDCCLVGNSNLSYPISVRNELGSTEHFSQNRSNRPARGAWFSKSHYIRAQWEKVKKTGPVGQPNQTNRSEVILNPV